MKTKFTLLAAALLTLGACQTGNYFVEENGYVEIEAENFHDQQLTGVRQWHIITTDETPELQDPDPNHSELASGNSYLEILPDTRVTHSDKLVAGESFSNEPGKLAVVSYNVKFKTPGKYYVWVRAFSTGSEDNGIHVGIDGEWPESGQRMQWCQGKHQWTWESKQRTEKQHCGVAKQIFLDVKEAGMHTISVSMREDGFEMDKIVLSQKYERPE